MLTQRKRFINSTNTDQLVWLSVVLWAFQLDFEAFRADLKPVHRLNCHCRCRRTLKAHESYNNGTQQTDAHGSGNIGRKQCQWQLHYQS